MAGGIVTISASPALFLNIVAFIVTVPVLFSAYRQPLKRRYHYWFVALGTVYGFGYFGTVALANVSDSPATFLFRIHLVEPFQLCAYPLLYGFVAYFVSPTNELGRVRKYVLAGLFAVVLANLFLGVIDPNYFEGPPVIANPTGYLDSPGNLSQYLEVSGISNIGIIVGGLVLAELTRFYFSQKNRTTRRQAIFLIVGVSIMVLGFVFGVYINRLVHISGFRSALWISSLVVLLVGIRRHGFYSVTPRSEIAPAVPVDKNLPPLEEGRSYLASDTKEAFEEFSSLVRGGGHEGLCISRTPPEVVRRTYNLQTTPVMWLAEDGTAGSVPPGDLIGLSLTVKDFLARGV